MRISRDLKNNHCYFNCPVVWNDPFPHYFLIDYWLWDWFCIWYPPQISMFLLWPLSGPNVWWIPHSTFQSLLNVESSWSIREKYWVAVQMYIVHEEQRRRTEKMNLQRKVSPSLRVCLVGTHLGLFLCESKRLWCTGVPAVCFILLIWLLCFVIVSVTRRSRSDVGHWVRVSRLDWCDPGEWWYLLTTLLMLL